MRRYEVALDREGARFHVSARINEECCLLRSTFPADRWRARQLFVVVYGPVAMRPLNYV